MKMFMTIGSVILFLIGGGLLLFSILFILAAFSPEQPDSLLFVGLVMAVIALVCIGGGIALVFAARKQAATSTASGPGNVSLNIDLPGKVSLDTMKCTSCGGVLSSDNIDMAAGAPVVNCPFCGTSYQLTEEPKW
jgi:hypothetical protein